MIKLVEIGKCCEIVSGSTPSRIEKDYWGGNINWTSIKDLSNLDDKFIFETSERITERGFKSCSTNMIPPNSLLLSSRAPIGHLAINKIDLCTNQGFKSLIPCKEVDVNYLYYAIKRIVPKLKDLGNGATFKELSKSALSKVTIPLPPLETQQRIASILDAADALRKKTQQLIDSYDELVQSIFLDMFGDPVKNEKGWEKKKLSEICSKIQIGPFGSQLHQSDYYESGIPLINPTNIKENQIKLDRVVYISEEKFESLPQYHLSTGDIIMARRGDLSKVGLIISNNQRLFCGTGSLFIRCTKSVNMIFIHRLLSDKSTTDHLISEARGITMLNLNKQIISNIPIMLPPLSLQAQFAEKIALIDQQKELAKQSLKESEDLFNTLLQKAFKGELELKWN